MPTYTLPDDWTTIDTHAAAVDARIMAGTFTALSSDEVDALTALANGAAAKFCNPIAVAQRAYTEPRFVPGAFRGDTYGRV